MKTIKVERCGNCPFIADGFSGLICNINLNITISELAHVHTLCPLKTEAVKIELK